MSTVRVEDLICPEASLVSMEFLLPEKQQVGYCSSCLKEIHAPK